MFEWVWCIGVTLNVLGLYLVVSVGGWCFVFCGGYVLLIDCLVRSAVCC